MDKIKEFISELSWRWDDPYFWADHQTLASVLTIIAGYSVIFGFEMLKIHVRVKLEQMGDITHG